MLSESPQCCGRTMTAIGVARGDGVLLHSCAACGRHAWSAGGQELDRDALIEVLSEPDPAPPRSGAGSARSPGTAAVAGLSDSDKRAELQDLLRGFTVHGTSS